MKLRAMVLLLLMFMLSTAFSEVLSATPKASAGSIERLSDFPSKYVSARNVDVWLPPNYPKAGTYAVIYMLDGQMLFDAADTWNHQEWQVDETAARLITKNAVRPFIVVGIWNAGKARHAEYFPQKVFAMLSAPEQSQQYDKGSVNTEQMYARPVYSDAFLRFLTSELKPAIDRKYQTKTDAPNTAIVGSSMGGLMAWYALSEYPKVFGAAGCMSTHWLGGNDIPNNPIPAAFLKFLSTHLPKAGVHRLWFDHGSATLDALYPAAQKQVDTIVQRRGYTSADWRTAVFDGADHSEKSWAARLDQVFVFLFPK
jgi:predicted alpha/beta superfamily hydrolase